MDFYTFVDDVANSVCKTVLCENFVGKRIFILLTIHF